MKRIFFKLKEAFEQLIFTDNDNPSINKIRILVNTLAHLDIEYNERRIKLVLEFIK